MKLTTVGVLLVSCLSLGVTAQGPTDLRPRSGVRILDYYLPLYLAAPDRDVRYLMIETEEIELQWELFNTGPDIELPVPDGDVSRLLDVSAVALSEFQSPRVNVGIKATGLRRRTRAGSFEESIPVSTLRVGQDETVIVSLILTGITRPGRYDVKGIPIDKRIVPVQGGWLLEVRPLSDQATRAELLLRRLSRALRDRDCVRVRSESDALLRVYPESSNAFQARAQCAVMDQDHAAAAREYANAARVLRSGQDRLIATGVSRADIQSDAAALERAAFEEGEKAKGRR